jgi:hypothetical protein
MNSLEIPRSKLRGSLLNQQFEPDEEMEEELPSDEEIEAEDETE